MVREGVDKGLQLRPIAAVDYFLAFGGRLRSRRQLSDEHSILGADHLSADILPVASIPTQVHTSDGATLERQIDRGVVEIPYRLKLREDYGGSKGLDRADLVLEKPACEVKFMNPHVNHDPTAHCWIAKGSRRSVCVALSGPKEHRPAEPAIADCAFQAQVFWLGPSHEADLKTHPRQLCRCDSPVGALQIQRQWLLTKDLKASPGSCHDDVGMGITGRRDQHSPEVNPGQQVVGVIVPIRDAKALCKALGPRRVEVRHSHQLRPPNLASQDPAMDLAHSPQADHPDRELRLTHS